jgi:hypothetical protein
MAISDDAPALSSTADDTAPSLGEFLIARGGPFYDLQQRWGCFASTRSTPAGVRSS